MFLSFVVTHDRTNQQLPHFSEAFTGVRPTLFYDPVTLSKSNYVAIVHALIGGKVPCEQIAPSDPYAAPYEFDWDKLVGRPAILFLEPSTKPDKNGLFINKLKSIEPPDAGVIAAIKALHQARKVETSEKGLAYLTYPATAYQDDADASGHGSSPAATDSAIGDELEDEIPF